MPVSGERVLVLGRDVSTEKKGAAAIRRQATTRARVQGHTSRVERILLWSLVQARGRVRGDGRLAGEGGEGEVLGYRFLNFEKH